MTTLTIGYSGAPVAYRVPAGVTTISVDCSGAGGGNEYAGTTLRGKGARVQCDLSVTPGEILWLYAGGQGLDALNGSGSGFNGGATSTASAGGGGGASDVRQGGSAFANRVIVAGGGGGAGANNGQVTTGGGGDAGLNGSDGQDGIAGPTRGRGATTIAGGAGGTGTANGTAGSLGVGGVGGFGSNPRGGGGGGGGLYGGGGGGASGIATAGGGGGGGSSLSTGVNSTITSGYRVGDGVIVLTFTESVHPAAIPPCIGDRFDRADDAIGLGTADTGQTWIARKRIVNSTEVVTAVDSVLGIKDAQAYDPSGTGNDRVNIYTIDHGFADADLSLTLTAPLLPGEQSCLVYRWLGDSHFWRMMLYRSIIGPPYPYEVLIRILNGSGTLANLGSVVGLGNTPTFPMRFRVIAVGGHHQGFVDDVLLLDGTTSVPNDTATNHGIALGPYLSAPIGRVNDYVACPFAAGSSNISRSGAAYNPPLFIPRKDWALVRG